jgi:hypothetical protein
MNTSVLLTSLVSFEVLLFARLVGISDLLKPIRAHGRSNNEGGYGFG